jgi:hypothetical protein
MYSYLHIAYAKPGYVADTSKNKICTRRHTKHANGINDSFLLLQV